jgi:hypothetical protein
MFFIFNPNQNKNIPLLENAPPFPEASSWHVDDAIHADRIYVPVPQLSLAFDDNILPAVHEPPSS